MQLTGPTQPSLSAARLPSGCCRRRVFDGWSKDRVWSVVLVRSRPRSRPAALGQAEWRPGTTNFRRWTSRRAAETVLLDQRLICGQLERRRSSRRRVDRLTCFIYCARFNYEKLEKSTDVSDNVNGVTSSCLPHRTLPHTIYYFPTPSLYTRCSTV